MKNVSLVFGDLEVLPEELKDDQYESDIDYLATLAKKALFNDPVAGSSGLMPLSRDEEYRRCQGGSVSWETCSPTLYVGGQMPTSPLSHPVD